MASYSYEIFTCLAPCVHSCIGLNASSSKWPFLTIYLKYTTLICLLPEPSPTHSWLPVELPPPLLPSPPHPSHHQDLMILPLNLPLGCPLCYRPSIQSSVQALIAFYLPLGYWKNLPFMHLDWYTLCTILWRTEKQPLRSTFRLCDSDEQLQLRKAASYDFPIGSS